MLFNIFPSIEKKRRSRYGSSWLSQLGSVAQVGTLGSRVGCRFLSVSVSLGYEGGILVIWDIGPGKFPFGISLYLRKSVANT